MDTKEKNEKFLTIDTESCNVWGVDLSDRETEGGDADEDDQPSRERRILTDRYFELAEIEARFWSKVNKSTPSGCWLWTASKMDRLGHGQFTIRDGSGYQHHLYAHRVAWALTGLQIAPGLKLCHRCDVPACVRPDHLFTGTQGDNLADARKKRRLIDGLQARKLSDSAYAEILSSARLNGDSAALALKFGVTQISITRIWAGKQGSTYRRQQPFEPFPVHAEQPSGDANPMDAVFERVPSIQLPVRNGLHTQKFQSSQTSTVTPEIGQRG